MAYLQRKPLSTGPVSEASRAYPWRAPDNNGGGGGPGGSFNGAGLYGGSGGGAPSVTNPWQAAMRQNYAEASARPYASDWRTGVSQAMALGNKDYTGDLRRMGQEDVAAEQKRFQDRLGAMGMNELSLRDDVTADWAKKRTDASTRAAIEGQRMQISAIDTMRGMLGSATGAELDRIAQMISAAGAGGGNYNAFMSMLVPLMEKYGESQRPSTMNLKATV